MKIILCSNDKDYQEFKKEKNKTESMKNFKERNIKVKRVDCQELELRIVDDKNKIIKLYNYIPSFSELYKYFPIVEKTDKNYSLYSNDNPDKSISAGFKDEKTAIETINKIKKKPHGYQVKVILTMYNRAKYHPHQTSDIKKAMKVYRKWLDKNTL